MEEAASFGQGAVETEVKGKDRGNLSWLPSELWSPKDHRVPETGRRKDIGKDSGQLYEGTGDKGAIYKALCCDDNRLPGIYRSYRRDSEKLLKESISMGQCVY